MKVQRYGCWPVRLQENLNEPIRRQILPTWPTKWLSRHPQSPSLSRLAEGQGLVPSPLNKRKWVKYSKKGFNVDWTVSQSGFLFQLASGPETVIVYPGLKLGSHQVASGNLNITGRLKIQLNVLPLQLNPHPTTTPLLWPLFLWPGQKSTHSPIWKPHYYIQWSPFEVLGPCVLHKIIPLIRPVKLTSEEAEWRQTQSDR